jgi:tetratricopeptide (TPR) repeat protein
MDTTLRPKLLDVVRFPSALLGGGSTGSSQGTVVEDFGAALLVEVSDDQGVPTSFATVPVDAAQPIWQRLEHEVPEPPADAKAHFEMGLLFLQNLCLEDAKQEFRTAFEAEPTFAGTLMNMANEHAKTRQYDVAIFLYLLVLELQPENQLTQRNLAAVLINRGIVFSELGALDRAIEDFQAAVWSVQAPAEVVEKAQHNLAAAYTRLGVQLGQIKRYRESRGILLRALELRPSEITRRNLAIAEVSVQASVASPSPQTPPPGNFKRALQMGLTFSECLNVYGATLMGLGDLSGAERALEAAVRADPQNEIAEQNLASVQSNEGTTERAPLNVGMASIELVAAAA